MSIWIRRRDQTGRLSYFAVDVPLVILVMAPGIVLSVLICNLVASPIPTLLVCFTIAMIGSVLIAVAKWGTFRKGLFRSFGSTGMSRSMKAFYHIGWTLVIVGTALTLLGVGFVLRV